ncbi:hypothetical protein FPQ18DRAFT_390784 [Pyronema domesticum]|nr:hypothetical protein FPQ18DRAFT_390784 [Pyronema domesticum]
MIITRLHLLGSIFFAVVTNVSADSLAGPVSVRPPITYPDNKPPRPVDVWCGKAYRATDAPFADLVEKGWLYPPKKSNQPLFDIACRPKLKPFLNDENLAQDLQPRIVIEATISNDVGVPFPALDYYNDFQEPSDVWVTVSVRSDAGKAKSKVILKEVPVSFDQNAEFALDLSKLPTQVDPYTIYCTAALQKGDTPFAVASSEMYWLPPNPHGGSTVVLDSESGKLLVVDQAKPAGYHSFFPIGYYTNWGDYLKDNFTKLQDIKDAGFTMVHPIPDIGPANQTWGNTADSFDHFIKFMDACKKIGLWVMYDMRWNYMSTPDVEYQVKALRSHPALLLWYTADEPDGHNDPTNSTLVSYRTISDLDGYHPISYTPNCQNYFFAQYASGSDIVIPDVYPISNNVTFSNRYNTACNRTYGCCGCDNCPGTLADLGDRVREMREFTRLLGMHKTFWAVGQGFGAAEFWERVPTGQEVVTLSEGAVEAGATGLLWWSAPPVAEIWNATSQLAKRLNAGAYASKRFFVQTKRDLSAAETDNYRSEL